MAEVTDDGCPVHHLPPDVDVIVWHGASPSRVSAALVCETWHDTRPLAAALRRLVDDALRWTPPHTDVPPAWRR